MVSLVVCGAINWDISCFVEHLPVPGQEVTVKRVTHVSGGTGANIAVAAARILGAGKVALIGALGKDDIARHQIAALNSEGLITAGIKQIAGLESGQAYILVDQKGENVIASHLGANAKLSLDSLNDPTVKQHLRECRGIVLTDPPLEVVTQLISFTRQRGIPVLWDPGILITPNGERLLPLAKDVEVLFLNETEARALLGTDGVKATLRRLQQLGFSNHTVLKLGAQGAVALEPASGTVIEVPPLPLKELGLSVVNTVGCGDAFAGVFAAYYVLRTGLQQSLTMASAAAGINATRHETRGSPDRATLEEVVNRSRNLNFSIRERKLL
ncbi:MAG: carbohydrate kinase family protein [Dehalococcoidia bacterium]